MEFFNSIISKDSPKEYETLFIHELKNKKMGKLNEKGIKKFRGLAVLVTSSANHMMRAIDAQLDTYKNVKGTGTAWNNESALFDFYNGLSELQAVCATIALEGGVEIKQYIGREKKTFIMKPFPRDAIFIVYLKIRANKILKETCIGKGTKILGAEEAYIDLNELSRLLRKRRAKEGIEYPENYNELVKKCKENYKKMIEEFGKI